jgi:hypothetical protein
MLLTTTTVVSWYRSILGRWWALSASILHGQLVGLELLADGQQLVRRWIPGLGAADRVVTLEDGSSSRRW